MTIADFAVLATAVGLGGILKTLIDHLLDRRRGRMLDEQNAWEQRDKEARHRRILEESLHQHRTVWLEHGLPFDDLPPWPKRPGT